MTLLDLEADVFQKQGCTFPILDVCEKECFSRQMMEVGRRLLFLFLFCFVLTKSHSVIVGKGEKDSGIW